MGGELCYLKLNLFCRRVFIIILVSIFLAFVYLYGKYSEDTLVGQLECFPGIHGPVSGARLQVVGINRDLITIGAKERRGCCPRAVKSG